MPEGPEVRMCADILSLALVGKTIQDFDAGTKAARDWLSTNPEALIGRSIESFRSRGKMIVGRISGGYYFTSHLYIWGKWMITARDFKSDTQRQERARIVVDDAVATLYSTTSFDVGAGDPMVQDPRLRELGPDTLPYDDEPGFDDGEFLRRLSLPNHRERPIGFLLLDQSILCGVGNYLRAEILFDCRISPWRTPASLSPEEEAGLVHSILHIVRLAYDNDGFLVTKTSPDTPSAFSRDATMLRPHETPFLVQGSRAVTAEQAENRYYVYGRSGSACHICGDIVLASKRLSGAAGGAESHRTIFYCPTCQNASEVASY